MRRHQSIDGHAWTPAPVDTSRFAWLLRTNFLLAVSLVASTLVLHGTLSTVRDDAVIGAVLAIIAGYCLIRSRGGELSPVVTAAGVLGGMWLALFSVQVGTGPLLVDESLAVGAFTFASYLAVHRQLLSHTSGK